MTARTLAAWQRPPRPVRKVRCCVCLASVRLTDTIPLWDERVCRVHLSTDDRRLRHEFAEETE